ncbi:NAD(P)H-dependent oxidoreductase [Streptomyces sp. DSM 3412]|uniref:NAD(P)H-dependent oxidoreductase n=1 Tax=Streptomyces gottesmaniae TaxID=3075518 RepID=A0ABU2Z6R5_9ACTN|nr:NAD(P)H-dependent oxidoreductase [Streptomyces sp. DSM 3412]MDT0572290.1 NAD(P)H-dependent oxidoreductase [Streptomyces sp. DSM 3412]
MTAWAARTPLKVAIIVGTTRPGRKADTVAHWVHDMAVKREDAAYEVVDIAEFALPHLNEPMPALTGEYSQPHTRAWADKVGSFDAYVFVTPEYNASIPGVLKNAIDYLGAEWGGKAVGFVGYGMEGGVRAVAHLRVVLGDLKVSDVQPAVELTLPEDFENFSVFTPRESQEKQVLAVLDALLPEAARLRAEPPTTAKRRTTGGSREPWVDVDVP